jgi:hypothetical protein
MLPGDDRPGFKDDLARPHLKSPQFRRTEIRDGADGGHMLRRETGIRSAGADAMDANRIATERRKGNCHAEELPASFPVGSVDLDHGSRGPGRRTPLAGQLEDLDDDEGR